MEINITDINIEQFRSLNENEIMKLAKSIDFQNRKDWDAILALNTDAKIKGYNKECKEGHDYIECGPWRYEDYEEISMSPIYDEYSEPGLYETQVKLCKRCVHFEVSKTKQLRSATLCRDAKFWK